MTESVLYKSLPIGSFGYWQTRPEVIETQVVENVDLMIDATEYLFRLNSDNYLLHCENQRFTLKLPQEFALINESDEFKKDICT